MGDPGYFGFRNINNIRYVALTLYVSPPLQKKVKGGNLGN